jgi:hypothetical protein
VTAKVTLPVKLPFPVGANVTVAVLADPEGMVSGSARLLSEKPAPLSVACVMVKSIPPLFDSVTVVV